MKLRVSHLAEADLGEIWLYVASDSSIAADQVLDRFQQHFALLAENPEFGELREELAKNLRQSTVGSYVVLYRLRDDVCEIVRVIHGARDLPKEYRRRLFGG